jgi:hypothetical protein
MKWLTGITLAAVIALSTSISVKAQSTDPGLSAGKQTAAQVTSINGSTVVVKTASGETQTYEVAPSLISSLKLENGSQVVIDSTRLQTGRIVQLGAYSAEVELDNGGGTKTYILTRESRRYLGYGDRVVVTPDLRLMSFDRYRLTAADLRLQPTMVSSSAISQSTSTSRSSETAVQQPSETRSASTPAPVESTPSVQPAPVSGLW